MFIDTINYRRLKRIFCRSMDSLSTLPPVPTDQTPREKELLDRFFTVTTPTGWSSSLKSSTIATIAFLLFANPMVDKLLSSLPYLSNQYISMAVKIVLFFVLVTLSFKYL